MFKQIIKITGGFLACVAIGFAANRLTHKSGTANSTPTTKQQTLTFIDRFHPNSRSRMIIEIMDFECPPCRAAHPSIKKWLRMHPSVSFTPVHLPLPFHPNAMNAAITAELARSKGKFMQAFDDFSEQKSKIDEKSLAEYLTKIDPALNKDKREREAAKKRVLADVEFVNKMKVEGTPTILAWDGYALHKINSPAGLDLLTN
jgi:protein-disulfide isomerase